MLVWLIHREAERSHITVKTDPQGAQLHISESITETIASYMRDFYRGRGESPDAELQEFVRDCPCKKLDNTAAEALEEEVTEGEISTALAQLQPTKMPGPSRLRVAVFRYMAEKEVPHLHKM
ncbi:hypothetical protein NDU88_000888 [Pleurodeles waltl]|uniref:Uncharacterized protein n=1 Tax=Pleurodeles waltl TaxID=8319 RepID=A0AAV7Q1J3_PLEWA|nr:hypothetical protein NDU88_000888 [Pleurodeles waltl]